MSTPKPKATRKKAKIGDRITFSTGTRQGRQGGTRVVKGFYSDGSYLVGFRGYTGFIVYKREVTEVIRKPK